MLPKLDVPIYEVKLISTGKTIRFRPFLVKEQKLFLMASEATDPKETINYSSSIKELYSWWIRYRFTSNFWPRILVYEFKSSFSRRSGWFKIQM